MYCVFPHSFAYLRRLNSKGLGEHLDTQLSWATAQLLVPGISPFTQ